MRLGSAMIKSKIYVKEMVWHILLTVSNTPPTKWMGGDDEQMIFAQGEMSINQFKFA